MLPIASAEQHCFQIRGMFFTGAEHPVVQDWGNTDLCFLIHEAALSFMS